MAEIVVKTRITPKKLAERIVSRERLVKLMESNISKNMTLITAPAGFGKTTLALDFLSKLNKPYAWFYVAPDISGFYSFMNYFIQALCSIKENFGSHTLELLESLSENSSIAKEEKSSINAVIGTFANEFINTFEDEVYFVIDDLQNAGSPSWLVNTFNSLIEDFPPNLHILITSRSVPEFNIARLNAKRNLLKIESADLHFNNEETGRLINEIYSIECGKNDVAELENSLEGWITGLHLILQAYGSGFPKAVSGKTILDENLFDYFANEIFNGLDEEHRDFLLETSLPDSFTVELCNVITGTHEPGKIIESLRRKNIFIEAISEDNGNVTYNYHNLFRQFLLKKLKEVKPGKDIKETAGKIFSFYEKNNDLNNAVEFSIRSGNYEKAVILIRKLFDDLFRSGRFEVLEKWISKFPDETRRNDNYIMLIDAMVKYHYRSDIDAALPVLKKLVEIKDNETYIQACIEYSDVMLLKGNAKEAVNLLEELIKNDGSPVNYSKAALGLAKAYYSMGSGYYDKIISLLDDTIKLNDENNIREFHSQIYSMYGRIYQTRGNFSKALHYFKNVVELEKNVFTKFQTYTNIVLLHSWSGEYIKANEFFNKTIEIYRHYHTETFKRSMLRITALFKFEAGDYEDAVLKFSELASLDLSLNIKSFLFLYYLFIAEAFILLGSTQKANEYIDLAMLSTKNDDEFQQISIDYHLAIIENLNVPGDKAEKVLLDTLKFMNSRNLIYPEVQVMFHLADYYFKKGNLNTAKKFLEDSFTISSQNKFSSFLAQHFISKRYLFDFAVSNNIQKEYVTSIHTLLTEKESYNWISAECTARLRKESFKLYDITVNTFGGLEIFLRGEPVTEDKWIRKKSKLLLVYILIHRELKHTKDKILELFFSELSPSSADNVFHQSITNIRNALNPTVENIADVKTKDKKTKPNKKTEAAQALSFISYEDKILYVNSGYLYKVDASRFSDLHSRIKSPQTDVTEKKVLARQAAELYKGEFLPGQYDEWIEELRTNLQVKFVEICEEMLSIPAEGKDYSDIIFFSERLISSDKLHEEAFIANIKAHSLSGNINMAKKKFIHLLKNYDEEYGEKPSKETLKQIEQILLKTT